MREKFTQDLKDAMKAGERAKVDTLRGTVVPADVTVSVTRDYGETAAEKGNELLWHMLLAVLSVSILIWLALGIFSADALRRYWRGAAL